MVNKALAFYEAYFRIIPNKAFNTFIVFQYKMWKYPFLHDVLHDYEINYYILCIMLKPTAWYTSTSSGLSLVHHCYYHDAPWRPAGNEINSI